MSEAGQRVHAHGQRDMIPPMTQPAGQLLARGDLQAVKVPACGIIDTRQFRVPRARRTCTSPGQQR